MSEDGKVVIQIEHNAKEASADFKELTKSTKKYEETLKEIQGTGLTQVRSNIKKLKEAMLDLALYGQQDSKVFKDLGNELRFTEQRLLNAENAVKKAVSGERNLEQQTKKTTASQKKLITTTELLSRAMSILFAYFGARQLIDFAKDVSVVSRQFDGLINKFNAAAGSEVVGAHSFEFVKEQCKKLGLEFTQTANAYAGFEAATLRSSLTLGETEKIFNDISSAIVSMHLSAYDAGLVFLALEQMASKGIVSTEELRRQLGDKLAGAFEIAAKSMGLSIAKFNEMIGNGEIFS